jgi:hypothetical protein
MSSVLLGQAPIQDLLTDKNGRLTKSWISYFNQISDGDDGREWTPIATNLAGDYTLTGKYFKNSGFIDFWIQIDPTTSSTSTLGTTYIDLPFDVTVSSYIVAIYGSTTAIGIVDPSLNRVFPPSWAAVASTITLTGRVFTK